ncbi:MAG: hypothetical protein ACOH5I_09110 [Oligoflexus sp.]
MNGQSFGSDNHSGVHPAVFDALLSANQGHQPAYSHDSMTQVAIAAFRDCFRTHCDVFFVFTGSAANTLAIRMPSKTWSG